jgi:apolipoprotein N-acyltransferase
VIGGLLVLAGAALSALAFPRIGPGWLILPGIALFLAGLRMARGRAQGLLYGALYGLTFFGGLIWWLSELGLIAVLPLVIEQAAFFGAYGWWLARYNDRSSGTWFLLTVGGWALMESIRYRFPVGGFEWGAAGYALSDQVWARDLAPSYGTTGVTVMTVMAAAGLVSLLRKPRNWWLLVPVPLFVVASLMLEWFEPVDYVLEGQRVAIVQGSTPCPFVHCPPDERLRTFEQHLELTKQIEPGSVFLVVWSEGSTGSFNADPVQNPEIGAAIAAEARRIGAWFLVGSDRPLSETQWENVNIVFNPEGEIVGEYHKQHPVPFGEYIPFRPLFDWIPELDQVPRDMIPGPGPVVFDTGQLRIGSVISFEGGFSRYPRQHAVAGANLIVVATNEGSYGTTPGSDQFIGMTRMRAAELGLDVVHAAVTGKSTFIDASGAVGVATGLGTQEVLSGVIAGRTPSLYARTGDVVMIAAALIGLLTWWRTRRPLVVSAHAIDEEE